MTRASKLNRQLAMEKIQKITGPERSYRLNITHPIDKPTQTMFFNSLFINDKNGISILEKEREPTNQPDLIGIMKTSNT